MCGFVGDSGDVKKLDDKTKKALKEFLRSRQQYLEGRLSLVKQDLNALGGGTKKNK
jgi:hypothetical protein